MFQQHGILRKLISIFSLLGALAVITYVYSQVWPEAPLLAADSQSYMEAAEDLKDGKIEALHDRTIGYPLFLLLTGSSQKPTRLLFYLQMILYFSASVSLIGLLRQLCIPNKFQVVMLVLVLLPMFVANCGYVLTETLTAFLLVVGVSTLSVWLTSRKKQWICLVFGSLSIALVSLVRPTYQLLGPIIAVFLMVVSFFPSLERKRTLIACGIVLINFILIVGGNILFNYYRFGYLGLTPLLGFNLSTRTVRVVERLPDSYAQVREVLIAFRDSSLIQRHSSHTGVMYIWGAIPELQSITGMDKIELSKFMLQLNISLIKLAPLEYLSEVGRAMSLYWFPYTTDLSNFHSRLVQFIWTSVHFVLMIVFFLYTQIFWSLIAFAQVLRYAVAKERFFEFFPNQVIFFENIHRKRLMVLALSYIVIIYTFVISTFIEVGNPRYRAPTDLLIIFVTIIISGTLSEIINEARKNSHANYEAGPRH